MPYDPVWTDNPDLPDPQLADAFAALPRELPLAAGQEDRTVAALRAAGFLPAEPAQVAVAPRASDAGVISILPRLDARAWRAVARVAVGLAASLALFAGGTLWGEARASRR